MKLKYIEKFKTKGSDMSISLSLILIWNNEYRLYHGTTGYGLGLMILILIAKTKKNFAIIIQFAT